VQRLYNRFLLVALVIAVGLAAYAFGRLHQVTQTDGTTRNSSTSPDVPPAPTASSAPATSTTPTTSAGASSDARSASTAARSTLFEIADRNIKAFLLDGTITWIGTSGGLIRYDVTAGTSQRYDNRSGLLSNGVFYLGKFGNEIWVGTYGGGLSVLETATGKWRNYNIPQGMADAFVYDVLKTGSGDIWIATWSGANRIVGGAIDDVSKWRLYTVENTQGGLPNDWVYGLAEGKAGEIWLATEGGLARFADDKWDHWNHDDGLGASYESVKADIDFTRDPGAVSQHHARQKAEQGLTDVDVAYNPNYIVSLEIGEDGTVWAGTWGGGLSRFDGREWRTYTVKDGLPNNHVFALAKDSAGVVWIGTGHGLARFDGQSFATYGRTDGLFSDPVFAIAMAGDGNTWIGSYGGAAWFPHGVGTRTAGQ